MKALHDKQQDLTSIVDNAINDRTKLRSLISLLYDSDLEKRFIAAKALGEIARIKPKLIDQVWRRISSAFDDTMSCWGVAEGLGEIARNQPEFRGRIVSLLKLLIRDDACCQGCIWAIGRIGQVDRERINDFIPDLLELLDSPDVCNLGQVIWTLGELKISSVKGRIEKLIDDNRPTWIFENEAVSLKTIGEIAGEAAEKLQNRLQGIL